MTIKLSTLEETRTETETRREERWEKGCPQLDDELIAALLEAEQERNFDTCDGPDDYYGEPDDEPPAGDGRLTTREIGLRGEQAAAKYLERMGYQILERNWSCPFGEADIIAFDDDEAALVFVEVKTRSSEHTGLPEEAVGPAKRRRYESIALAYLRDSDLTNVQVRFDVIALTLVGTDKALIRHHLNAFGMGE